MTYINNITSRKKIFIILSLLIAIVIIVPIIFVSASNNGVSPQNIIDKIKQGEKNIVISDSLAIYQNIDIPNDITLTINQNSSLTIGGGNFNNQGSIINNGCLTFAGGTVTNIGKISNTALLTVSGGQFINNGTVENSAKDGMYFYSDCISTSQGQFVVTNNGIIKYSKTFYDMNGANISGDVKQGAYIWDASLNGFKFGSKVENTNIPVTDVNVDANVDVNANSNANADADTSIDANANPIVDTSVDTSLAAPNSVDTAVNGVNSAPNSDVTNEPTNVPANIPVTNTGIASQGANAKAQAFKQQIEQKKASFKQGITAKIEAFKQQIQQKKASALNGNMANPAQNSGNTVLSAPNVSAPTQNSTNADLSAPNVNAPTQNSSNTNTMLP